MFVAFAALDAGPPEAPADDGEVEQLVRAARVGNAQAARRLYALHVQRVFRVVRPFCATEAEAEDVTQDAFADALGNLSRYSPRPGGRFVGWLMTLALNRARKQHARGQRTEAHEASTLEQLAGAADDQALEERVLLKRTLLTALAELSPRDREVVTLYFGAELSAAEVAKATGVSAANVRKICERASAALSRRLSGQAAA